MPESVSFMTAGILITEEDYFQHILQEVADIPKIISYIGTDHPMRQILPIQNAQTYIFALDSSIPATVAAAPYCTKKNIQHMISQYVNPIEHIHVFFDNLIDNNAYHPCTYCYTFHVLIV
jgi:hypothetical protein